MHFASNIENAVAVVVNAKTHEMLTDFRAIVLCRHKKKE